MPKRLFKQRKEGFKKTGRTLSENGRPEIFAQNRTIPAKTEGLESNFTGVLTDSGINDSDQHRYSQRSIVPNRLLYC